MASRQEEKEARRQERLEQEAAERRSAARKRRVQIVAGALLAAVLIAGGALALTSGGDDGGAGPDDSITSDVKLPEVEEPVLDKAAELAGCTVSHPPHEGEGHEEREFTAADYKTNPPTSGTHFPQWAQDGVYTEDNLPPLGELVHTLEHGRINVQYKPGTPQRVIDQLNAFVAESDGGYHMLLYPNPTEMDAQVAATAWDHMVTCPDVNDKTWDVLRAFRLSYIDKGPETVP